LERLRDAVREDDGSGRFIFVTTHQIKSESLLERIVGRDDGEILIDRLFDGSGDRSKSGRIRKAWRDRLCVNDEELETILSRFSIQANAPDLKQLSLQLDATLTSVGLAPIDHSKSATLYDDVIWRWYAEGVCDFNSTTLKELCQREKLFIESQEKKALVLGIRTFTHPIDDLALRVDNLCDLRTLFDGRSIRNNHDWKSSIGPSVNSFLVENARKADRIRLALDTHYSVAIVAGYSLNLKSGKQIEIEQRTGGQSVWTANPDNLAKEKHDCVIEQVTHDGNADIILELSLTRDVSGDVLKDIKERDLDVFSHIKMRPSSGTSSAFVRDGSHAYSITEGLIEACRKVQATANSNTRIHLYFSGPNAIAFYIGQHAIPLGELIVYEWDFERSAGGGYRAGLSLPI